jgi:thioredoxin reductase (NADPH)
MQMSESESYDVVIAGGGLAGLTAALVAARHGLRALVLEPAVPGGHLVNVAKIEDFPGFPEGVAGYDLGPIVQEQAERAGAAFRLAEALALESSPPFAPLSRPFRDFRGPNDLRTPNDLHGPNDQRDPNASPSEASETTGLRDRARSQQDELWRVDTTDGPVVARAVIVATGSRLRDLGIPGEARLIGRGVSHCATCDGPLFRNKVVGVVGGGDSACQEALTLAEYAARVILLTRARALAGQSVYQQRLAERPTIERQVNALVEEVLGETAVTGLRWRNLATGQTETLDLAGLFVYVGLEPNTRILADLVPLDPAGHVLTDVWMRTERPGLFAAGDIRQGSARQAISAAGDGATAAVAAYRYLQEMS